MSFDAQSFQEKLQRPSQEYCFTLPPINSCSGVSLDTLNAIAFSYGAPVEKLIQRALVLLAIDEIADFDLDSPFLTNKQLEALQLRRQAIDDGLETAAAWPTVHEQLAALLRVSGNTDELPESGSHENKGAI